MQANVCVTDRLKDEAAKVIKRASPKMLFQALEASDSNFT